MITQDGLVERDETFSIGLTTSQQDAASGYIVIGRDVAQITINDLDSKLIIIYYYGNYYCLICNTFDLYSKSMIVIAVI